MLTISGRTFAHVSCEFLRFMQIFSLLGMRLSLCFNFSFCIKKSQSLNACIGYPVMISEFCCFCKHRTSKYLYSYTRHKYDDSISVKVFGLIQTLNSIRSHRLNFFLFFYQVPNSSSPWVFVVVGNTIHL
jgi:hypothetical protein